MYVSDGQLPHWCPILEKDAKVHATPVPFTRFEISHEEIPWCKNSLFVMSCSRENEKENNNNNVWYLRASVQFCSEGVELFSITATQIAILATNLT